MAKTGLTGAELVTTVKTNLGDRTDKTTANLLEWLNLAQVRLGRIRNWSELFETASVFITPLTSASVLGDGGAVIPNYKSYNQQPGTATISTDHTGEAIVYGNGGLKAMESIRMSFGASDADGPFDRSYMLSYLGRRQFRRLLPNPESTLAMQGYPSVFTEEDEQLYLYKIPNKAYLLEIGYFSWPSDLADDATTSTFDGKDDILINLASSIGFHSLGMREQGGQYYAIANAVIADAEAEDGATPSHVITGKGTSSTSGNLIGEPWNDPFVNSIG